MNIVEHQAGDVANLHALARQARNAEQRDRYRSAALAIEGRQTQDIQERLHRSRGFVQRWAYAYREGGIAALQARRRGGRKSKLPPERVEEFRQRLQAGARPEDGVCTLRGRDTQRILKVEFGVPLSLSGAYDLLHRLGYSCLKPRPRHEKQDPKTQQEFRERAPLLSAR